MKTYKVIRVPLTKEEFTGAIGIDPWSNKEYKQTRKVFDRWGYEVQKHTPAVIKTRIVGTFKKKIEEYEEWPAHTYTFDTVFNNKKDAEEYIKILKESNSE